MTKQLNLRLDDDLHARIVTAAKRDHRSLNGEIEWALDFIFGAPRNSEIHHKDGDRTSLELSNLELRKRRASAPETTESEN